MPIDRPFRDADDWKAFYFFLGLVVGTLLGIFGFLRLLDWFFS